MTASGSTDLQIITSGLLAAIKKVDEDLARAQAELRAAQGRVTELSDARRGLEYAIRQGANTDTGTARE